MYHRYGELSLRDLWPLVCENIVSVFLAGLFFATKSGWNAIAGVGMLGCAAIPLYSISSAMSEKFAVRNNTISISKFGKKRVISLPEEITVVVSYADIRTPFAVYTALGKETRILPGRYAVTILHKAQISMLLERLHHHRISKYTASSIQDILPEYQYIYSFVGNVSLLTEVQQNAKCSFIIPVSLKDQYNELREIPHAYFDKEA